VLKRRERSALHVGFENESDNEQEDAPVDDRSNRSPSPPSPKPKRRSSHTSRRVTLTMNELGEDEIRANVDRGDMTEEELAEQIRLHPGIEIIIQDHDIGLQWSSKCINAEEYL
jgi:hypothetical protein